ncbi:MAG: dihydrofolate reductase [Bacteroidetes bacterium]|nr:MAG: dihydrofolate reductase [Bacteroidota bacterium]
MKQLYSLILGGALLSGSLYACQESKTEETVEKEVPEVDSFEYMSERFADLQLLRYKVPGFEDLTPKQKELAYYLYEAALCGRDIIYDQKYKHNLAIRKTIENIAQSYTGDKSTADWNNFMVYVKRVWFSNGIHHHYSNVKFTPEVSEAYFAELINASNAQGFPYEVGSDKMNHLVKVIMDPSIDPKIVNQAAGIDNVVGSSNNFYEGVTQAEVDAFYKEKAAGIDSMKPEFGLNSKLVKVDGKVQEKIWKVGGMYGQAIEKIVYWLEKAATVAENEQQEAALRALIKYYNTGDVYDWDAYNMEWVKDVNSRLDVVNGFIEVYLDAIGKRGSFESVVSFKDMKATERIQLISKEAQWFEDNSPILPNHKKAEVKGIEAKVITVIVESGDAAPSTPIGINLPNNNWVREKKGSKSVSLGNVVHAYNVAGTKGSTLDEFAVSKEVADRIKQHGALSSDLHTDMHEVIGHASGRINDGIGTPDETLKQYASCLEEARADLVALYFIMDPKLVEIGVMPSLEVGKAEYDSYIMNGLITQLTRIKLGDDIEEAHMRNRQLVVKWAMEKGANDNVIEIVKRDGKSYVQVNDYAKLRDLFGQLLREIQRIKSEGDFKAGQELVENYGVKVDPELHKEVLERYAKLNLAPYKGFIQPKLVPQMEGDKIVDVKVEYPTDFTDQMLFFSKEYSFLPLEN